MIKRFIHRHQPVPVLRAIPIAGVGAAVAISFLGLAADYSSLPLLMAPFGASCVLLFGAHSSPLSQPANVLGGHILAATLGVLAQTLWPGSVSVAGIAVGLSLMAMMALRIVHPPAGATALVAYMSAKSWMFVLFPTAVGSLVLVIIAALVHVLSASSYPLAVKKPDAAEVAPSK